MPGDELRFLVRGQQRRCSQSPCRCSRRPSTAAGEIWLACIRAALRRLARSTRMHRSTRSGRWPVNASPGGRQPSRLVVGVAGDAGVAEDQQPDGPVAGGQPGDVRGELTLRRAGEAAIGVPQQDDGRDSEGAAGLPQLPGLCPAEAGAGLVQVRGLAVGIAQQVSGGRPGGEQAFGPGGRAAVVGRCPRPGRILSRVSGGCDRQRPRVFRAPAQPSPRAQSPGVPPDGWSLWRPAEHPAGMRRCHGWFYTPVGIRVVPGELGGGVPWRRWS